MEDLKFIETLIKMLVNHPNEVKAQRTVDERGVMINLDVNPEDVGILIGKEGRNINAIRHLARMIGMKNKSFISVRLNQPEK